LPREVPIYYLRAQPCGGYGPAVDYLFVYALNADARIGRQVVEEFDGALAVPAEGVIVSYDDLAHSQLADEKAFIEVHCVQVGHLLAEVQQ
jgi:hypothetical protein